MVGYFKEPLIKVTSMDLAWLSSRNRVIMISLTFMSSIRRMEFRLSMGYGNMANSSFSTILMILDRRLLLIKLSISSLIMTILFYSNIIMVLMIMVLRRSSTNILLERSIISIITSIIMPVLIEILVIMIMTARINM